MRCPVCGNDTIDDWYDICEECGWEDEYGSPDDYYYGANHMPINHYKKIYESLKQRDNKFRWKNEKDRELMNSLCIYWIE